MDRTLSCVCHYRSLLICIASSLGPPGTAPDFPLPIYCAVSSRPDGMSWGLDAFVNGPARHGHHRSCFQCLPAFCSLTFSCPVGPLPAPGPQISWILVVFALHEPLLWLASCCVFIQPHFPFLRDFLFGHGTEAGQCRQKWGFPKGDVCSLLLPFADQLQRTLGKALRDGDQEDRWKKRGSWIPGRLYASKHSDMLASSPYPHEQNITFCALTPQDLVVVCYNS